MGRTHFLVWDSIFNTLIGANWDELTLMEIVKGPTF